MTTSNSNIITFCPVLWEEKWEKWRRTNGAKKEETPFDLLKRLRQADAWERLYSVTCPPDRFEGEWWGDADTSPRGIEGMLSSMRQES